MKSKKVIELIEQYGIELSSKAVGGVDILLKILDIKSPMDFLHLFDDLDVVRSEEETHLILFVNKNDKTIMIYETKKDKVLINHYEILRVLHENFLLGHKETRKLTERWLNEVYNLRVVTISSFVTL